MAQIIDSHTHRYPPEVFRNPYVWGIAQKERHWASLVAPTGGKKPSLQGWADREQMLEAMDESGVDRAILLGWYWEQHATCELQNSWYAQWIKEDPQRFSAFAAVQPLAGEQQALDTVRWAADEGFVGIGEMFPRVQGFAMDDLVWLKIVEFAIERGLAINIHVTEPVGRDYPAKVATPFADFQWLAQTYPELKLILAHWGGGLLFYELNPSFRQVFKNVYYDTAASPLLYDSRIYCSAVDIVGAKKILFGSDYPLRLYPHRDRQPCFSGLLREIDRCGLDPKAQECLLGGNVARLLNL